MRLEQLFETSRWLTLYRGEYSGNKGGKYWSEDREFARQFTQSGRDSEVMRRFIHSSDVYDHKPYAYAGDMDEIEAVVAVAKHKGFSAVRLSEAKGHDDDDTSIYVFDRSALKFSMREGLLLEKGTPPSNSVVFQRIAGNLMHVLAYKISHSSHDHKTFGVRTASDLGGINLLAMKRFYKPRDLPPLIVKFLKEKANLRIAFSNNDRELAPEFGGHYDSRRNEILLRMSDEQFNQIRNGLKDGHTTTVPNVSDEQIDVLVHELTHAYDDWISAGKYQANSRSQEANQSRYMARVKPDDEEAQRKKRTDYFNDPIEINARFYQTINAINRSFNLATTPWKTVSREFVWKFPEWKPIPDDEKRRLIKRFARVWLEDQRPRERNYVEDVDKLGKKLREEFGEIYIRYNASPNRQSILMDTGFKKKLPIEAIQAGIRFCDIRNITLGLEAPFTPDLKSLGFVKNAGRTKRYDLSWLCTCYREPRRK